MESKLIQLPYELWEAIDHAAGDMPRGRWIDGQLRKMAAVRRAADELGLEFPARPGPGEYDRSHIKGKKKRRRRVR